MVENQDTFVRLAAEMMLARHGDDAAKVARERAEAAERIGDFLSSDAWRDLAHAIEAHCWLMPQRLGVPQPPPVERADHDRGQSVPPRKK